MSDLSAADQAGATVKAIVDNAEPLGLVWGLRPATITKTVPPEGILDGDSVSIGLISMVGAPLVGQRVYVLFVPPAGNYVVGFVNEPTPRNVENLLIANTPGSTVTTTYLDMPGSPALIIDKIGDALTTCLLVRMFGTAFTTGSASAGMEFAVLYSATDFGIAGLRSATAFSQHTTFAGERKISPIPAGRITLTARWRLQPGTPGQVNVNGDDNLCMTVEEVLL